MEEEKDPQTEPDVEQEQEQVVENAAGAPAAKKRRKADAAALTINVYSWATPLVGILMLVVGLVGGYYLRPYLTGEQPGEQASNADAPETAAGPPPSASFANADELMAYLTEEVRHIKGDGDAPITIIEFSDFQ